ncbi:IgE binding [Mactra antiquata]
MLHQFFILFACTSLCTQVVSSLKCYNCPIQSTRDGCQYTTTCPVGKICMFRKVVSSDGNVRYQTLCKGRDECVNEINTYPAIVGSLLGSKRETHQIVTDDGECLLQCCDHDECNVGCSSVPTTTTTTTTTTSRPVFNIPTPPPHLANITTTPKPPSTTHTFLIPTTPKLTTTMSTSTKATTTTSVTMTTPSTTTSTTTASTPIPTTSATTASTPIPTTKAPTTSTIQTTTPTTTIKPTTSTVATTVMTTPIVCEHGSYMFDNGCYIIPREEMSFRRAETFCASMNSRLVQVDSAQENDFLKQTLRHKNQPQQYWIGITDIDTENTWVSYDDHKPAVFFDWMPGEPDGKQVFDGISEADCAVFDPWADFQWRDEECSPYQFSIPICERR